MKKQKEQSLIVADELFHKSGLPHAIIDLKIGIRFTDVVPLANILTEIPKDRHTVQDVLFVEAMASMHLLSQSPDAFGYPNINKDSASIYFNFLDDPSQ